MGKLYKMYPELSRKTVEMMLNGLFELRNTEEGYHREVLAYANGTYGETGKRHCQVLNSQVALLVNSKNGSGDLVDIGHCSVGLWEITEGENVCHIAYVKYRDGLERAVYDLPMNEVIAVTYEVHEAFKAVLEDYNKQWRGED